MMEYQHLLDDFVASAQKCFPGKLTGVYLHGSLAMGCFRPEASDIDLLVVLEEEASAEEKLLFLADVVRLNQTAPAKGIEMSVVRAQDLQPIRYPTPFQLHFSPMHLSWFSQDPQGYVDGMQGLDKDLGAHCRVIRERGVRLYGGDIGRVFGPVPDEAYLDAILYDVDEARDTMADSPVSTILNLCRALAFVEDKACFSKQEGGRWAMEHLPERLHPPVAEALRCYEAGLVMTLDADVGLAFAEEILPLIHGKTT